MSWELLLVPSAPGLVVAFLLLAARLEDRTLAPRPVVAPRPPGAGAVGETRGSAPA